MAKLLVTGGAGFIGANFIHYWLKAHPGDQIVNLDKLTYAGNLHSLADLTTPNYHFLQGDITDPQIVDQAMSGIDLVVHFAAESHVDRSILGPQVFIHSNILGTQVLLEAAVKHHVSRFHHVSTDEVYGSLSLGSTDLFSETTKYSPNSPYSASKAASDLFVLAYFKTFGLPVTLTNCSNNYGPYQYPEKFLSLAITNLLENKKVPIYGDGLNVRDWLYVEDHCRAIDLVLAQGKVGETYCVGGLTEDLPNIEVIKRLCKLMHKDFDQVTEHVQDRPGHDRRYAVNWQKIKTQLGWQPSHDFDTALAKTVAWYTANPTWWQPLKRETELFYLKLKERQNHAAR